MHDLEEVRMALDVPAEVPIFMSDARDQRQVQDALLPLLEYVLAEMEKQEAAAAAAAMAPPQPMFTKNEPVATGAGEGFRF